MEASTKSFRLIISSVGTLGLIVFVIFAMGGIHGVKSNDGSPSAKAGFTGKYSPPAAYVQRDSPASFVKSTKTYDAIFVATTVTDWRIGKKHDFIRLKIQNDGSRTVISTKVKIDLLDTLGPNAKVVHTMLSVCNDRLPPGKSKQVELLLSSSPHAAQCRSDVLEVRTDPSEGDISHISKAERLQIMKELDQEEGKAEKKAQDKYGDEAKAIVKQVGMTNELQEKADAAVCKRHKITDEQKKQIIQAEWQTYYQTKPR